MTRVRVMVVDDHEIVRAGLRMLLDAQTDVEIVAEAGSGVEALNLVEALSPDVVLMDVTMPEMDGIQTTRELKKRCPGVAVLALTIHEDEDYLFRMLEAGASGYIPKRAAPEDLLRAIHVVHEGEVFLHSSVAGALVRQFVGQGADVQARQTSGLTEREQEVLILIAEGLPNKEIGDRLGISPRTVARHRDNIVGKLKLSSRSELTRYAIQQGLIKP